MSSPSNPSDGESPSDKARHQSVIRVGLTDVQPIRAFRRKLRFSGLAMSMRQAFAGGAGAGAAPDLDSRGFACVFLDCLGFPWPRGVGKAWIRGIEARAARCAAHSSGLPAA